MTTSTGLPPPPRESSFLETDDLPANVADLSTIDIATSTVDMRGRRAFITPVDPTAPSPETDDLPPTEDVPIKLGTITFGVHPLDVGIYVGRGSIFGNPFKVEDVGRAVALDRYRDWVTKALDAEWSPLARGVDQLAVRVAAGDDLTLCCFCGPAQECHAYILRDVIVERARFILARP